MGVSEKCKLTASNSGEERFKVLLCENKVDGTQNLIYNGKMIGAVAPVSASVVVGSFMFGLAMQLAGGCGSGTLFTASSGNGKMVITLVFFMIGSLVGTYHFDFWRLAPSLGGISLLNEYGKVNSVLLQLSILLMLYYVVFKSDQKQNIQI